MKAHNPVGAHTLARRRALRNDATPQERILWARLRSNHCGVRFRRQHSVGSYILDFYCPTLLLAIEVDGSQHLDQEEYDARRSAYLSQLGIRVLRFGNNEINTNIDGVMIVVLEMVAKLSPTQPPLKKGEERSIPQYLNTLRV